MKSINILFRGVSMAILFTAAVASAGDFNGTWTWTTPGRDGGPERTSKLTLKTEGTQLNGKLSAPGRDGAATEIAIRAGKVEGDAISFQVVRENNGNSNTNHFTGRISGDKITGKIEATRNGEKQSRDWEAKRWVEGQ